MCADLWHFSSKLIMRTVWRQLEKTICIECTALTSVIDLHFFLSCYSPSPLLPLWLSFFVVSFPLISLSIPPQIPFLISLYQCFFPFSPTTITEWTISILFLHFYFFLTSPLNVIFYIPLCCYSLVSSLQCFCVRFDRLPVNFKTTTTKKDKKQMCYWFTCVLCSQNMFWCHFYLVGVSKLVIIPVLD